MLKFGTLHPGEGDGDYSAEAFKINMMLMRVNTSMPVIVDAVRGGGLAPVGYIDCTVAVMQITGDNQTVENTKLTNVPYMRYQGGANAVIIDPKAGDIGLVCFCQRDISSVKNARKKAPPPSRRSLSLSDGVYVGGILNGTPTQYIHFTDSGIVAHSPTKIIAEAPNIDWVASESINMLSPIINCAGAFNMTGAQGTGATMKGGVTNTGGTISSDGINLETHVHSGVTTGGGNTGGPV